MKTLLSRINKNEKKTAAEVSEIAMVTKLRKVHESFFKVSPKR